MTQPTTAFELAKKLENLEETFWSIRRTCRHLLYLKSLINHPALISYMNVNHLCSVLIIGARFSAVFSLSCKLNHITFFSVEWWKAIWLRWRLQLTTCHSVMLATPKAWVLLCPVSLPALSQSQHWRRMRTWSRKREHWPERIHQSKTASSRTVLSSRRRCHRHLGPRFFCHDSILRSCCLRRFRIILLLVAIFKSLSAVIWNSKMKAFSRGPCTQGLFTWALAVCRGHLDSACSSNGRSVSRTSQTWPHSGNGFLVYFVNRFI